ncbi:olfactory receptor 12D3 [Alligator mississippiensis]|uniref:Olfactory receptor n=1 Tax=Alligator mississippiensis TaxID=8496 RepID=A0A151MJR6_ALLMI|nr:olfactory receptor 12D3 [Alligator mississippiensis]KYO24778.1 olfactory receptor 12D3-like [Alligator mississippiensis]
MDNMTLVTEFILFGVSDTQELHSFLFGLFLLLYLTNVSGNLAVASITLWDSHLCTPMYFFVGNLSFIDIFYSSTTVPKMFVGLVWGGTGGSPISWRGCITQMFFFYFLGSTEAMLLTVMGYDRYLAVCRPLHYPLLMSRRLCWALAGSVWTAGFFHSLLHAIMASCLSFCCKQHLSHFFCDVSPLLEISCSDIQFNQILLAGVTGSIILGCLTLTIVSYAMILRAVLGMRSAEGLRKAFSTCGAHLTLVAIRYGCSGAMYLRPRSQRSLATDRLVTVLYTAVTPVLNPLIYTLRNKEVKAALRRVIARRVYA